MAINGMFPAAQINRREESSADCRRYVSMPGNQASHCTAELVGLLTCACMHGELGALCFGVSKAHVKTRGGYKF